MKSLRQAGTLLFSRHTQHIDSSCRLQAGEASSEPQARADIKNVITFEPNRHGGRLKYLRNIPVEAQYWDELWEENEASVDYSRYEAGHLPLFLKHSLLSLVKPGARILEAGCGLATFTVAAAARGFNADGVDYAPDVIARLQKRFPKIRFYSGDVRNLPDVPDNTYDALYSPGVCEHFEEGPQDVLREAHRIIKRGGILLVSTPCFNAFRRYLARRGKFASIARGIFYQYAFSAAEMSSILEDLKFDVLDTRYHGALKTVRDHIPSLARIPLGPFEKPLAIAMDTLTGIRTWGHSCLWVARKR